MPNSSLQAVAKDLSSHGDLASTLTDEVLEHLHAPLLEAMRNSLRTLKTQERVRRWASTQAEKRLLALIERFSVELRATARKTSSAPPGPEPAPVAKTAAKTSTPVKQSADTKPKVESRPQAKATALPPQAGGLKAASAKAPQQKPHSTPPPPPSSRKVPLADLIPPVSPD